MVFIGSSNKIYPYGVQKWNDNSINNTSGEKWTSGIFKATNTVLRQILRSDVEQWSVFLNILYNCDVMYIAETKWQILWYLVWLDMGLTNSLKKLNTLNASVFIYVRCLLSGYLYSVALNSAHYSGKRKVSRNVNRSWQSRIIWKKACCLFYASLFKEKGSSEKGLILISGEKFI